MRFLFLIPDLTKSPFFLWEYKLRLTPFRRFLPPPKMRTEKVWGGTLNIMRHCALARSLGADAYLATQSGSDTYGPVFGVASSPFVRWEDRRPDDICILPDIYTSQIDKIQGWVVAYQQVPSCVRNNFDHSRERVLVWTDSPHMLKVCQERYPGKDIPIVPNIVDNSIFPFIAQSQRRTGELMAFPRKGPEFIHQTMVAYHSNGGTYWKLNTVDGLPLSELADRFRTPQAFLASASVEGCALPPQEAMAAGIAVVGRDAGGANFYMRHNETALVANTPEAAAQSLCALEDSALRQRLSLAGHDYIQRYFPDREPSSFWRDVIADPRWNQN